MGWATRIISHDDGGYLIANTTNGVAENDVSRDPHHGDTLPDYWILKSMLSGTRYGTEDMVATDQITAKT